MREVDIIIPTVKSPLLVSIAIKAYEKFTPNFKLNYIVVENSYDETHREYITSLAENVTWIKNGRDFMSEAPPIDRSNIGSYIVASSYEKGLESATSDLVFFSHNDVAPVSDNWLDFLVSKIDSGFTIAGMMRDDWRIYAVHSCSLLTTREYAKSVSFYPVYEEGKHGSALDVGDKLSLVARRQGMLEFACRNTHNHRAYAETLQEPFKSFKVVRCLDDDGKVIFLHLGRGTPKHFGRYSKQGGSALLHEWVAFLESEIKIEIPGER